MSDILFMKKALSLAAKAKGRTSPNPLVGAVLVKGGKVIASGYHRKAGFPHAEAIALQKAGRNARGSVLYVNLEPCCHTEKRTPPCAGAIIRSGVKRVVVGMIDPNPRVSGQGIQELRKAGIKVDSGVLEKEAKELNESFIKYITKKEPFVTLKIAQSLDGRIATAKGESKWITGEKARKHAHRMRNEHDAVLVGIDTVLKDDPSLDCRIRGGRNPYRIIVDTRLRIPVGSKVLMHHDGRTMIATAARSSSKGSLRKLNMLRDLGAHVIFVKESSGRVDLKALMRELAVLGIMSVMIEGGSTVNASALSAGIVDRVVIFAAPMLIGGTDSIPSIGGRSPALLRNAYRIRGLRSRKIGDDVLLEGYLYWQRAKGIGQRVKKEKD